MKVFFVCFCLKYNDYKLQEGLFETRKLNEIKHAIVMKGRFSNKVSQPRRAKGYLLNFLREIQHLDQLEQKSAHYVSNVFKIQQRIRKFFAKQKQRKEILHKYFDHELH